MDKNTRKFSFYKIVYDETVYVFIGSNGKYKDVYLSNPRLQKGLGSKQPVKYINDTIFDDDLIEVVIAKIKQNLKLSNVYLWCKKPLVNRTLKTYDFLMDVFASRKFVSSIELSDVYLWKTGKRLQIDGNDDTLLSFDEAIEVAQLPTNVLVTLGFSRNDNGKTMFYPINPSDMNPNYVLPPTTYIVPELSSLIGDNIVNRIINVVSKGNAAVYFPVLYPLNVLQSTSQIELSREFIPKLTTKTTCFTSYIQVHVKQSNGALNIFKVFSDIEPTPIVPFVKWISSSNTLFKLHKSYLSRESSTRDLTIWTRPPKYVPKKARNSMVVKIPINKNNIATIIIDQDGTYYIRISYKKNSNPTLKDVSNNIFNVYNLFFSICNLLSPPDIKHLWSGYGNTKIVKMVCGGKIEDLSITANKQKIESAATLLNNIFVAQASKTGFVNLMFKRFDDFCSHENINNFMNQYRHLEKDAMLSFITYLFSLDTTSATSIYKSWAGQKDIDKKKRATLKSIQIVIRPRNNLYEFVIEGTSNILQIQRIINAIIYLINLSKDVKEKKGLKLIHRNLDKSDGDTGTGTGAGAGVGADDDDDGDSSGGFDFDLDDENDDKVKQFFDAESDDSYYNSNSSDVDDDDVLVNINEIKNKCPPPPPARDKVKANSEVLENKGQLLSKLKDADKKLFYDTNSTKKYSNICQAVSKKHPVVLTHKEIEYNNTCFPGAIGDNHLNTGSTPELSGTNYYTCPKVWCPKTRVALTMEQFKAYGSKCPFKGIKEVPMVVDTDEWKDRERHIYYVSPKFHASGLCMPCCGLKKMTETNNKCTTQNGNVKYIKDRGNSPIEEGRYGLLSLKLTDLFQNKFCGGQDGEHGLMGPKTDCYLKNGMPLRGQPLFQSMIASFDNEAIKSNNDIVDIIVKNLDMTMFLGMADGLICKAFLPTQNTYNSLNDENMFNSFKEYFNDQVNYRNRFGLKTMFNLLTQMPDFDMSSEYKGREAFKRLYKDIMREYQFYQSLTSYIAYIKDDKIVKTHEFMYPWFHTTLLNPNNYNVVILEENTSDSFVACPIYQSAKNNFDVERPTVFFNRSGNLYEPIHRVYYSSQNVNDPKQRPIQIIDKTHIDDKRASKVINIILSTCVNDYFDENGYQIRSILDASAHSVKTQVLDFNFHVVAFYTATDILVPLKKPISMDLSHSSSFMFIDTCLKKYNLTIDDKLVKGVLNNVNKIIPQYYQLEKTISIDNNKVALKLKDIEIVIPIYPYVKAAHDKTGIYEQIAKDGAIFTMYENNDPRKTMISMNKYIDLVFITFKNEIVNLITYVSDLKELVNVLRHNANPLPWSKKREILIEGLKVYLPKIIFKGADTKSLAMQDKARQVTSQKKLSNICSTEAPTHRISQNINKCINQCSHVTVLGKKLDSNIIKQCKLSVPTDYYELLLERSVEFILNPISNIHDIETVSTDTGLINNNIIMFSRSDFEGQPGGINIILQKINITGNTNYTVDLVNAINNDKVENRASFLEYITVIEKPNLFKKLVEFTLCRVEKPGWMFELFTVINQRINPKTQHFTEDDITKLWVKKIKSDYRKDPESIFEKLSKNFVKKINVQNIESDVMEEVVRVGRVMTDYELDLLAKIVGINVFVTNRQTTQNPDRMRCYGKVKKDYYIMLHEDTKITHEYNIYMRKDKFLLTNKDFGERFSKCVLAKCSNGIINGDLAGICPPYK